MSSSASMSAAHSPTCSCFDAAAGTFRTAKVPSQRGDEARAFINGLRRSAASSAIGSIVHGTTVGTNTLLERRGPKIGVITTRGFRDVLEMRRRDRRRTWGLWGDFVPIADRDMRVEVDERTLADGNDPPSGRCRRQFAPPRRSFDDAARRRSRSSSSTPTPMPTTSARAVAAARAVWPNAHVTASHEVLPEIREFERSSTTALNAYLQPVVGSYHRQARAGARRATIRWISCTSCSRTAA